MIKMSQEEIYEVLKKAKKKLSASEIQEKIKTINVHTISSNLKRLRKDDDVYFEFVENKNNNKNKMVYWVNKKSR